MKDASLFPVPTVENYSSLIFKAMCFLVNMLRNDLLFNWHRSRTYLSSGFPIGSSTSYSELSLSSIISFHLVAKPLTCFCLLLELKKLLIFWPTLFFALNFWRPIMTMSGMGLPVYSSEILSTGASRVDKLSTSLNCSWFELNVMTLTVIFSFSTVRLFLDAFTS